MGVRHFCMGTDLNVLFDWLGEQGEGLRSAMAEGGRHDWKTTPVGG